MLEILLYIREIKNVEVEIDQNFKNMLRQFFFFILLRLRFSLVFDSPILKGLCHRFLGSL